MKKRYIVFYIIMLLVFSSPLILGIIFLPRSKPIHVEGSVSDFESDRTRKVTAKPIVPEMVLIPGGILEKTDEKGKVKKIKIKSFYMGKYEVTYKEYCSLFERKNRGDNLPITGLSWSAAQEYCNWLSRENKLETCYEPNDYINFNKNGYRLPTEAEWEYACMGGSETKYYWGDEMNGAYCWYEGNSGKEIHEVGKKKPNAFGLYDMIGNAPECCNNIIIGKEPLKVPDPFHIYRGWYLKVIVKGGGFFASAKYSLLSSSFELSPNYNFYTGFRLARTP